MTQRSVLITGASTGIGRATADLLHASGWKVIGASRRIAQLEPKPPFTCVTLDVANEADVQRVVREVGPLDAVVNCAGWVLAGAIDETSDADARRQLDANLFGLANVCRAVTPRFREQGHGWVVNVGSIAGQVPMAFQAWYSVSKAGVAALTSALRLELEPYGVQVTLVEPGDFATPITASRQLARPTAASAYPAFARSLAIIERDERAAKPPTDVARVIVRTLNHRNPPPVVRVGPLVQRLGVPLRALLPARFYDWLLVKLYAL